MFNPQLKPAFPAPIILRTLRSLLDILVALHTTEEVSVKRRSAMHFASEYECWIPKDYKRLQSMHRKL